MLKADNFKRGGRLSRHFETTHHQQWSRGQGTDTSESCQTEKKGIHQNMFLRAKSQGMEVSPLQKQPNQFTEGNVLKNCALKVCDIVCLDKRQAFANIGLIRNIMARQVDELTADLQLRHRHCLAGDFNYRCTVKTNAFAQQQTFFEV